MNDFFVFLCANNQKSHFHLVLFMKTELILVGKTVNKHFVAGIKDYTERINHYMPFGIVTIPELKNTKNLSEELQKEREGAPKPLRRAWTSGRHTPRDAASLRSLSFSARSGDIANTYSTPSATA